MLWHCELGLLYHLLCIVDWTSCGVDPPLTMPLYMSCVAPAGSINRSLFALMADSSALLSAHFG